MQASPEVVGAAALAARRRSLGPPRAVFVNLWARSGRDGASVQADCHDDLDEAAADAASPSLYAYAGTLMAGGPDGPARLLDLSAHGEAVLAEAERGRRDEDRLSAALGRGAGRPVL
ncbi:MAG: hypothetical protein HQL38_03495 [Alphaproteobacteria bacterium]|nr:hypothetical protein [Alphaproteobacteria bacterium]MBF0391727.1 hypothetical protein [Alphaproteobacteria bacterium]